MRGRTSKLVAYFVTLIVLSTAGAYLLRAGQQGKASSSAPEQLAPKIAEQLLMLQKVV